MYHRKRKHVGHRSKYTKVPIKTKLKFLKKVILEGISIKDVKPMLNIVRHHLQYQLLHCQNPHRTIQEQDLRLQPQRFRRGNRPRPGGL